MKSGERRRAEAPPTCVAADSPGRYAGLGQAARGRLRAGRGASAWMHMEGAGRHVRRDALAAGRRERHPSQGREAGSGVNHVMCADSRRTHLWALQLWLRIDANYVHDAADR